MAGPLAGADNAPLSFRCSRCGNTFSVEPERNAICPVCGFNCNAGGCQMLEASDEGY